jgi:hypothetical protein
MQITSALCGPKRRSPRFNMRTATKLSWYIDRKDAAAALRKQQTNQVRSKVVRQIIRLRSFYAT